VRPKVETTCYSYFNICSEGEIQYGKGLVAAENGVFNPDDVTELLGTEPHWKWRAGDPRKDGASTYGFSSWSACRQDTPVDDAHEQCLAIARILKDKIPALQQIKREYNVSLQLVIVPVIFNEKPPVLFFDKEIIDFCHATGAEIGIDTYVCDREPWLRMLFCRLRKYRR